MKKVFFQGSFDLINHGHVYAFRDAKKQGDYLIVGLNSDELVKDFKERDVILPFWQRKIILEGIKYIDEVVKMDNFSPLKHLKDIDVYVIYQEWLPTKTEEIAYMQSKGGKIFVTPEYEGVTHSSEIRRKCREVNK